MIAVTPQMRVFVALEPADFRAGIDGLAQRCRAVLQADPFSGGVFIFRNRSGTGIRLLTYDGQGYWLCYKRLSAGKFKFWPTCPGQAMTPMQAHEVHVLLRAGDPSATKAATDWRPVGPAGSPAAPV